MGARRWKKLFTAKPLHESSQRSLCRLAFLLGALLPVLLTLTACLAEFVPAYQRSRAAHYQSLLSNALGCPAEVTAVELRAPSQFILHGIKLFHPETSELLARVQTIDVCQSRAGFALRLINPELPAEQLASAYRLLHEQILCRPAKQRHAAVAWIDGLSIRSRTGARTPFRSVRLELRRLTNETHATLGFSLDGVAGHMASLSFSREHTSARPTSHLELDSGGQRLPGTWVNLFAPQFALPGDAATFTGHFELDYVLNDWMLKGDGQLLAVDTTAWTQRPMLSGLANLTVNDFAVGHEGLEHIHGTLAIKDGRVHDDMLQSAKIVGISPAASIAEPQGIAHPFSQLAFDFALDARGLVLKAGLGERALARDPLGTLAEQYYVGIVPLENLVIALSKITGANDNGSDLVKSPTVRQLVRWLPRPVTELASEESSFQANAVER